MQAVAIFLGSIGLISLLVQTVVFVMKFRKMRNWIKVEGTVIRIDEREWSGDIDREAGIIYTPIVEFTALETKQKWTFGVPSSDYPFLQKVGAKTTVAYPPNEPTQVIVFDRKYLIKDFVKWTFPRGWCSATNL
jgi:hypothetical protein